MSSAREATLAALTSPGPVPDVDAARLNAANVRVARLPFADSVVAWQHTDNDPRQIRSRVRLTYADLEAADDPIGLILERVEEARR